jgi:hypothetical protein
MVHAEFMMIINFIINIPSDDVQPEILRASLNKS